MIQSPKKHYMQQFISELPDFLQYLHQQPHNTQSSPIQDYQYRTECVYNQNNRYAVDFNDLQLQQTQSLPIIRYAGSFQLLFDPLIQCQKLIPYIQNETQNLSHHIQKFLDFISQVEQLNQIQNLIQKVNIPFNTLHPFIAQFKNKFIKGIFCYQSQLYQSAFQNILCHLKSQLFQIRIKQPEQINAVRFNNLIHCFEKLILICKQDYKRSKSMSIFINLLKNLQIFSNFNLNDQFLQPLKELIQKYLDILTCQILQTVEINLIVQRLLINSQIQLKPQIEGFFCIKILENLKFSKHLNLSALKSFQINTRKNNATAYRNFKKGITIKQSCYFCNQNLWEQDQIKIYGCGHYYHSICNSSENYCLECSYISDDFLFQRQIFQIENINHHKNNQVRLSNATNVKINKKINENKIDQNDKFEKNYQLKRKMKIFDYETYQQQKINLNPQNLIDQLFNSK